MKRVHLADLPAHERFQARLADRVGRQLELVEAMQGERGKAVRRASLEARVGRSEPMTEADRIEARRMSVLNYKIRRELGRVGKGRP